MKIHISHAEGIRMTKKNNPTAKDILECSEVLEYMSKLGITRENIAIEFNLPRMEWQLCEL